MVPRVGNWLTKLIGYDSDGPNSHELKYYIFSLALPLSVKPLGFLSVAAPVGLLNLGSTFALTPCGKRTLEHPNRCLVKYVWNEKHSSWFAWQNNCASIFAQDVVLAMHPLLIGFGFFGFVPCSPCVPINFPWESSSSQCVPQYVPNCTTLSYHMLCPKLSSSQLHRWAIL